MRISIRVQLGLLVLLNTLVVLCVIALAVWINNHRFIINVISSRLALAASLKSAQITSSLQLLNSTVQAATSRIFIQDALRRYINDGNNTEDNWEVAISTLMFALDNGRGGLLQAVIWPPDGSGPAGLAPLFNATVPLGGAVYLPSPDSNSTEITLGDLDLGFPPSLYPNVSAHDNTSTPFPFNTTHFNESKAILLGPLALNTSFALLSLSVPILNNGTSDYLGYMTVVASADLIISVLSSREGLFNTGETLLVGPDTFDNRFPGDVLYQGSVNTPDGVNVGDYPVRFEILPIEPGNTNRHTGNEKSSFPMRKYPAVLDAFTSLKGAPGHSQSFVSAKDEEGHDISVGYAVPNTTLCQWVLLVEEDKSEAYGPIGNLRNIILACVFSTIGAMMLLLVPVSHYAVTPVLELKQATSMTRKRPGSPESEPKVFIESIEPVTWKDRFLAVLKGQNTQKHVTVADDSGNTSFRIPSKVRVRGKHVQDEFSDLCQTYNEMIDELLTQYETLEDRVQERTRELQVSKKVAEVANESKSQFIASISHELRTPLNGILGMCSICLSETDMRRIKKNLSVVSESGELLLSLLEDVLTFNKHQLPRQVILDEKSFRLEVIGSQIIALFQKQAIDAEIDLHVKFENSLSMIAGKAATASGEPVSSTSVVHIEDLRVWGDKNRIMQVLINLVSNSLKFTPSGASIQVRIRCVEEEKAFAGNQDSLSRQFTAQSQRPKSGSAIAHESRPGSGNLARPMLTRGEAMLLPRLTKTYIFEFDVQDTGPGIPEHLQQRIFEPFVQGDAGLSRKFGGTGLGLSICTQLAKAMGGRVLLNSTPGLGSTFTLQIPMRILSQPADSSTNQGRRSGSFEEERSTPKLMSSKSGSVRSSQVEMDSVESEHTRLVDKTQQLLTAEARPGLLHASHHRQSTGTAPKAINKGTSNAAPQPAASEKPAQDRIRVLVADDNAINLEIVQRMLKLEKITDITLASDGQEAFDRVKDIMEEDAAFSIIFMDIQMPVVDGIQSTRLIRQTGYQAPIVALTAFTEESNIKECLESGMNHFLPKPIRRPALKQVLSSYCSQSSEGSVSPQPKA